MTPQVDPRLTRQEAATYLGISRKTLANWASTGRYGLRYHKTGTRVIYLKSELDAWIASRGTTQAGTLGMEG
ncbi:helix-turn-helix transcriptional regulator [Aeromonas sanarellii]